MLLTVGAITLNRGLKEIVWLLLGIIGFLMLLFNPELRDPQIIVLIFGLLGLPAFAEFAIALTRFMTIKNGNGSNGNNGKNANGKSS